MSIQAVGLKAYAKALNNFKQTENSSKAAFGDTGTQKGEPFGTMLEDSLGKVNSLQTDRSKMITSFAAGEQQNVHELMIAMQKASIAMNMTSAVRNKVIEAYKELSRIQF